MVRRDGSKRGDELIHYECGLPWADHIFDVHQKAVCPDASTLWDFDPFNEHARPLGKPMEDDPEDDDGRNGE